MISSTEAMALIQLRAVICNVERDGFAIVPNIIDDVAIDALLADLLRLPLDDDAVRCRGSLPFAIRNLVNLVPSSRRLAAGEAVVAIARDGWRRRVACSQFVF